MMDNFYRKLCLILVFIIFILITNSRFDYNLRSTIQNNEGPARPSARQE